MELFNEITTYIKRTKLDNAIFKLLLLYNTNLQDSLCYDLIQEVTKKIENSIAIKTIAILFNLLNFFLILYFAITKHPLLFYF